MKVIFATTCYEQFLKEFHESNASLHGKPFSERMEIFLRDSFFGAAPFYTKHFRMLGIETQFHILNAEEQKQWAQEQNVSYNDSYKLGMRFRKKYIPWIEYKRNDIWMKEIFLEQVKLFKPDVIVSMNIHVLSGEIAKELKKHCKFLVGQCASPAGNIDISSYDLIVTTLPSYIEMFRNKGIKSEYLKLGFPTDVLRKLEPHEAPETNIVFAGGIGGVNHKERIEILESLLTLEKTRIYGYLKSGINMSSPLRRLNISPLFGLPMFQAFYDSRIVFNNHIDIAGKYAANMRMYEATGVGSLLLTDYKDNIHEIFEPDKEIVVYKSAEECFEKAKYLLEHEDKRAEIAEAGQKRTLAEHTYKHRSEELLEIINRYI